MHAMDILTVEKLCKSYPGFSLSDVSFSLEPGKITGFIGRNGAGKTTTLKSLMNLVHPDGGEIRFWGKSFEESELEIKRRVGFAAGGISCYPIKKIKTITAVTRRFYPQWDTGIYEKYIKLFGLDENKTPAQLSEGMKVKYSLALALSHHADLLILDEPTSGLDPVSREELLDIFMDLCGGGTTILFSTHITSDLEKCADNIIYIHKGRIAASDELTHFLRRYQVVSISGDEMESVDQRKLIGCKRSKNGYTALIPTGEAEQWGAPKDADLETIMVHMEKDADSQ